LGFCGGRGPALKARRNRGIDFIGLGLIALGLGCLEIFLDRGVDDDWFESGFIQLMAVLAALGIVGAIVWLSVAKKRLRSRPGLSLWQSCRRGRSRRLGAPGARARSRPEHDPQKGIPVFGKGHAQHRLRPVMRVASRVRNCFSL
jgi:hypothetical protein